MFLESCNATNIIAMDEMEKLKNEITAALNKINGVNNSIITYNIPPYTNEYLSEELENLTEASTTLIKEFKAQKEICYKMNFENDCEENNILKKYLYFYKPFANGIHAYIVAASTLLSISFYYISKARKCELSDEQKKECDRAFSKSILIAHSHFWWIIINGILLYFDSCPIKEDHLGRFSI